MQKIAQHKGDDPFDLSHVLAYLGIARARTLIGDKAGARQAYEQFFAMWRNADRDVPVLVQAKAEYAKISTSTRSRATSSDAPPTAPARSVDRPAA